MSYANSPVGASPLLAAVLLSCTAMSPRTESTPQPTGIVPNPNSPVAAVSAEGSTPPRRQRLWEDERPAHAPTAMVHIEGGASANGPVSDYWLDRYEVGYTEYAACMAAGECAAPVLHQEEQSPHPNGAALTGWQDGSDYCSWIGKRLPTAQEWLWAARGRGEGRSFPWGEDKPTIDRMFARDGRHDYGVIARASVPDGPHIVVADIEGEHLRLWIHLPTDRGARPSGASRDGVLNMAGNVQEAVQLPSGLPGYLGGGYRYELPDHPDAQESDVNLPRIASHLQTAVTKDVFHSGSDRGHGVRCAADAPPAGSPVIPKITVLTELRVVPRLGMRRHLDAQRVCGATDMDDASWRLPTADQMRAIADEVVNLDGPYWTATGERWSRDRAVAPEADTKATARVLCVAEAVAEGSPP